MGKITARNPPEALTQVEDETAPAKAIWDGPRAGAEEEGAKLTAKRVEAW